MQRTVVQRVRSNGFSHALCLGVPMLIAVGCGGSPSPGISDTLPSSGCRGTCTTLATGSPYEVIVSGDNVYWTETGGGGPARSDFASVLAVPTTGGTPKVIASGSGGMSIAADAASIYWTSIGGGTIGRAALDGTSATTLAMEQNGPEGVAADANAVYWVDSGGFTVAKLLLSGGAPETLAVGLDFPSDLAIDDTSVYWTNGGDGSGSNGTIMKANLDGTDPVVLASSQNGPWRIAVDSTSVYWTNFGAGAAGMPSVMKVALNGGKPTVISTGGGAYAIALDSTHVYWTSGGSLMKAPLDGGDSTLLAVDPNSQLLPSVAVDADNVYWTTLTVMGTVGFGSVMKMTPK